MVGFSGIDEMARQIDSFACFNDEIIKLSPSGYIMAINFKFAKPDHIYCSWPDSWQSYYLQHNFVIRDPVLHWGIFNTGYIRWSQIDLNGIIKPAYYERVIEAAGEHDLKYGATFISKCDNLTTGSCLLSTARNDREFTDAELELIWEKFTKLISGIRMHTGLTKSETEVLQCLAYGMTQNQISDKLGISRESVKKRIERSRASLKANNTIHAVTIALKRGAISY